MANGVDSAKSGMGTFERIVLVAVLAVLGLQYYAYDVMYRILAMPTMTVNVPAKTALDVQSAAEQPQQFFLN